MTRLPAGKPQGAPADKPAVPPPPSRAPGSPKPGNIADDDVLLTARQRRKAARVARRQAKDAAYDLRQQRKRAKDGTSWRGHHIVDSRGLADAFPEPESPELSPSTVRRRIFHGVILVVLLAMVVASVVLAGMVQRGELKLALGSSKPTPAPITCPAETLDYAANKTVTVSIFNGGSVEGEAGKVAAELKKRGFAVKAVANGRTEIAAPAVVVSGPGGHAAALSLQRNFPGSDYVQDERADATVDVILTSKFTALAAVPKVDQKPGVLSCPHLSPPPSEPAPSQVASPAAKQPQKP